MQFKIVLIIFFSHSIYASGAPKHGAEFTFTNSKLIKHGYRAGINEDGSRANRDARDKWARAMEEKCKLRSLYSRNSESCTVKAFKRRGYTAFKVEYPDGWFYTVTVDPLVIEVNTAPITLNKAKEIRHRMQRDIFDHAANDVVTSGGFMGMRKEGLKPHRRYGGGHVHFDLKTTFKNDALLFRNFMVDFANHPTLGIGSFAMEPNNAPPLAMLSEQQRRNFAEVIKQFDQSSPKWDIKKLAQMITSRVYYDTRVHPTERELRKNPGAWTPKDKYQAVNLTRIISPTIPEEQRTLEIRAFAPQKSADEFIKEIELFDRRIDALRKLNKPIPYHSKTLKYKGKKVSGYEEIYPQILRELKDYVEGAGLSMSDYSNFIPPEIVKEINSGKLSNTECKNRESSELNTSDLSRVLQAL